MSDWDGKTERRRMDQDWIQRDRLLTEIHSNTKDLPKKLDEHIKFDDKRFIIVYLAIIIVASASGVLNNVISLLK